MKKKSHLKPNVGTLDFPLLCLRLLDSSPKPMVTVDKDSRSVCYANRAFCDQFINKNRDLTGRKFDTIFSAEPCLQILALIDQVAASGMPQDLTEVTIEGLPDAYWSLSIWPIFDDSKKILGFVVEMTLVTEIALFRKKVVEMNQYLLLASIDQHNLASGTLELNRRLQNVDRIKNEFIAVMSHEIRSPLTAIIGFSDLLSDPNLARVDRVEFVKRIKRNGIVLSHLIGDILDLSKIEADQMNIEKIQVELPPLFDDVFNTMNLMAEAKNLLLKFEIDPLQPTFINTDPIRFKQILSNIIGNAIKFTSKGFVTLVSSLDIERQIIRISVRDSGEGISEENIHKLFQPFSQAESSVTRRFGGTGLGLHLSRRLAQALGGNVVLISSQIGCGSIFEITIRIENPIFDFNPIVDENHQSKSGSRLEGIAVLLVEDAEDNQFLFNHILTHEGATVVLAGNGERAIKIALGGEFDIILMDIGMPVMDGLTATKKLRGGGYKGAIIALTAHAMKHEIDECIDAGFTAHISKPVDIEKLIGLINEIIRTKNLRKKSSEIIKMPTSENHH